MELAGKIVAELGIEHFFNIQLVGDYVIEINPRISTIVYQEDLNLPYLGVKRALGEISDDELRALRPRSAPAGRRCATSTSSSGTRARRTRAASGVPRTVTGATTVPIDPPTRPLRQPVSTAASAVQRDDDASGHALPGQRRRHPVGERAGAAA